MRWDELIVWGLAGGVFAAVALAIRRSNQLFVLRWQAGTLQVVRGRLPQRLFAELQDSLGRLDVKAARLVVVRETEAARVLSAELTSGELQVIRNVVGQFPVASIRQGTRTR